MRHATPFDSIVGSYRRPTDTVEALEEDTDQERQELKRLRREIRARQEAGPLFKRSYSDYRDENGCAWNGISL